MEADKSMPNGEIIPYQPDSSIRLEVRMEEDTVWLNRQQMARLFDRDVKTIGKHINNALKEELSDYPVVAKFATTASDGKTYQVDYYNLDVILSVGYRVKSKRGIEFRRWANFRRLRLRGEPYPVGTETHHPHRQLHRRLGAAERHNRQVPRTVPLPHTAAVALCGVIRMACLRHARGHI